MKAIILAAGRGSRMGHLTKDRPKAMLPFLGKTLLERQVENFISSGVSKIIVITGYMDNAIDIVGIKKIKNENYATTNMVESLFCSRGEWDDTIIVSYGDIVYERSVLRKLISSGHDINVVVDRKGKEYFMDRFGKDYLDSAESLKFGNDGTIRRLGDARPMSEDVEGQYIGLLKFTSVATKEISDIYDRDKASYWGKPWMRSKNFENGYMTDMVQRLIDEGRKVYPVITEGGWLEFDSEEDQKLYNTWNEKGTLRRYYDPDN